MCLPEGLREPPCGELGTAENQLQDETKVASRFCFFFKVAHALRHALCHVIFSFKESDENSRNHKTLAEEDALGKLTRIASACHGATVIKRFFERYVLFCALHWENLENLPEDVVKESW